MLDGDDDADQQPPLLRLRLATSSSQAWGFHALGDCVGAGFDAESLVRRLELEARIADAPNLSSLTLRGGESGSGQRLFASIHGVDKNLIVFASNLPQAPCSAYIVYDAISKSLSMIPSEPPCFVVVRTTRDLIARRRAGYDDGSYALVLMAKTPKFAGGEDDDVKGKGKIPEFIEEDVLAGEHALMGKAKRVEFAGGEDDDDDIDWQDVLLLWPSSSSSPWKLTKTANLPSNCDDLLSDDVDRVDFSFIDLPPVCQVDLRHTGKVAEPEAYRTMGCAGGSIRFVSIDGFIDYVTPADRRVTLWRLLPHRNTWVKEYEVSLKDLWNQEEFYNANLPKNTTPMYPILSTPEEHVICFMLGEYYQDSMGVAMPTDAHCLLQVDMSCGRILSSAPLPSACSLAPIIVGSDFISYLSPAALAAMRGLQSRGGVGDLFDSILDGMTVGAWEFALLCSFQLETIEAVNDIGPMEVSC
ncbi:hypothetical protein E2562_018973 [Oryza meyeriana var. granulata]|uniref:DUF1618 domain-containing protein n=1 Tax=Oryza meyeriana var. granulata TaxID=110450 RepID=A0A6G1DIT4_9ORYZ|nr:hypothetical protein E2562_018973 [Oryza meyeriana var. granulata]